MLAFREDHARPAFQAFVRLDNGVSSVQASQTLIFPSEAEVPSNATLMRFCFPGTAKEYSTPGTRFIFCLTSSELSRTFGYVLYTPFAAGVTAYCILSDFFDPDEYFRIMADYYAKVFMNDLSGALAVVAAAYRSPVERAHEQEKRVINTSIAYGFIAFDLKRLCKIVTAMMLSHRIVIIGQSFEVLSRCAFSLIAMIHPLPWPGVFIPILPPCAVETLYAPFPYIIGIHSSMASSLLAPEMESFLSINLDERKITEIRPAYKIPSYCRRRMTDFQNLVKSAGLGQALRQFILLVLSEILKKDPRNANALASAYEDMSQSNRPGTFEGGMLESQLIHQLMKEAKAGPGSYIYAAYWNRSNDSRSASRPPVPLPPPPTYLNDILVKHQMITYQRKQKSIDDLVNERKAALKEEAPKVVVDDACSLKNRIAFFSQGQQPPRTGQFRQIKSLRVKR